MMQIIEQTSCYRLELGRALHLTTDKIMKLFEKLLEESYMNDYLREKEMEERIKKRNELNEQCELEKKLYEDKIMKLENIIKGKNCELRSMKATEVSLEDEIKSLRDILQLDAKIETNAQKQLEGIGKKHDEIMDDPIRKILYDDDNNTLTKDIQSLQVGRGKME